MLTAMLPSDDQKRYERFMELVKKVFTGSHQKEKMYKIGQNFWRKVKADEAEYKSVFNDLIARSVREKKKTVKFWAQQAKKVVLLQQMLRTKKILRAKMKSKYIRSQHIGSS